MQVREVRMKRKNTTSSSDRWPGGSFEGTQAKALGQSDCDTPLLFCFTGFAARPWYPTHLCEHLVPKKQRKLAC